MEERYDRPYKLRTLVYDVLTKVLLMVVIPLVDEDSASAEKLLEFFKRTHALRALRHNKPMDHLKAGSVAFAAYPILLQDKADGEASFSVHKTNNPAKPDQPFLLIARTGRIVTAHTQLYGRVPPDPPGIPAYSQMLTTLLPTWRAAIIYLRTVHFCYSFAWSAEVADSFLVSSRSRLRGRTISSPSVDGAWRIVSEGSRRLPC
jgi:hypothetical protein